MRKMTVRERIMAQERENLSPYAALSEKSRGRRHREPEISPQDDLRTIYQRDRDRVIHCKAFRRLKGKTQVFLSPRGDHYRTRLTHTLEVAQIARTIARALQLNEDLTEAVALAHDLGHTPFGHAGEKALQELLPGGFLHYEHSVRVVDRLEKEGRGLNLTEEVRDGILHHTRGPEAFTMEGRIIRVADRIAYMNHDIDDALRANVLNASSIPREVTETLGETRTQRITTLISSVVAHSKEGEIRMDPRVQWAYERLHDFMYQSVYISDYAKREEKKVPHIMEKLYRHFLEPARLPDYLRQIAREEGPAQASADFVSGMTDQYAIACYEELFIPKAWQITAIDTGASLT